jgi:hypothetical protein
MKRLFTIAFLCAFSCCLHAQAVDTTVCEILKNPAAFNGKIVRVKGTVAAGFDQFVLKGVDCPPALNNNIWLSYPEGSKAKAGPAVMVQVQPARNFAGTVAAVTRTPVQLEKNSKDFKQFENLLTTVYNRGGMCLGCIKFEVTATLVGRLDGDADAALQYDKAGKIVGFGGFGHMNAYNARLVIQSVSEVVSKEINYSKALAITKDEEFSMSKRFVQYPVEAAQKDAKLFGAGNPSGEQMLRAVAIFPKGYEHNGVVVATGSANEAAAKFETKAAVDSPDGLLFTVTFNSSRLESDAQTRAYVFAGENVANLRTPLPGTAGASLFDLGNRAWVTTVLDSVITGQKTLTVQGGYLLWNKTWPPADVNTKLQDTIVDFLKTEELLHR